MVQRIVVIAGFSGFLVLGVVAYFLWAIWISRYVVRYGFKPAFFLAAWAPFVDYAHARRVARKVGAQPWFLKLFGRVLCGALFFMFTGLIAGLITLFTKQP